MKKSDKWVLADVHIHPPTITPAARDAIVAFLQRTIKRLEESQCTSQSYNQPQRIHRLRLSYK